METINGEVKERYVGPLADVVKTYIKLKEKEGVLGEFLPLTMGPPGFEPGTTSVLVVRVVSPGWHPSPS
ncbi:integrase [Sulfolobus islandicus HVE10/4]|uniref:Integrase n=2 Tax=Saccharolobus islandicus TaxID=43080 RepID=F0NGW0_SACI5|nr:integrase [Sulfolobus islandicus HVE10/4]ADX85126.1 integrase [Sulfolobus islandicus REY15A]